MRLSILIPTHNRPKLFERCITSAINQLTSDVEIIVNNDSCDIVEVKHAQVTYHYNKYEHLSHVYQFLLLQASGDYVYFLEDDDYLNNGFTDIPLEDDMVVGNYYPKYDVNPMEYMTLCKDHVYHDTGEYDAQLNLEHLQLSQFIFKRELIIDFDFPNDSHINNDIKLAKHSIRKCNTIRTMSKIFYVQTIDGGDNISFTR